MNPGTDLIDALDVLKITG